VISEAVQDYLKAIYNLQAMGGAVSTSALAEAMGVSAPSATGMVKKLAGMKLLRHTRYQGVVLTRAGEKIALEVLRHHRLLELYLAKALGYSWDKVHEEAETLEHAISEEFEERIFEALGRPTLDPHGHPIPTREGTVERPTHEPLSDLEPGATAVIRQVSDGDAEMLRYLGARGLIPEAAVEVVEKAPFDGPLTVRMGGRSHVLGRRLASQIRVKTAEGPAKARRGGSGNEP
jgi:DtxR family transcriptional regulator, Mn-dependent transcriptional regulator